MPIEVPANGVSVTPAVKPKPVIVALEDDARRLRKDAGGILQAHVEVLHHRTGADRQPVVDLHADDRIDVEGEDPRRARVDLARPDLARIGHEAERRRAGEADPERGR